MTYTIHAVLAAAYKGKRAALDTLLTHASTDGGLTAVCGKVKADNLCDFEESELTCKACIRKVRQ